MGQYQVENMVNQYTEMSQLSLSGSINPNAGSSLYRSKLYPWRRMLAFLMVWMLSVLLVAGFALGYLVSQEYFSPFRAVEPRIIPALTLILAATLAFWLILALRYRQSGAFLEINQQGLLINLPSSRSKRIKWGEIEAIAIDVVESRFLWLRFREHWQAWIYYRHGLTIALPSGIDSLPEAITRIKAAVFPNLLKGYRQEFSNGAQIKFGPLVVSQEDLQINLNRLRRKIIPWDQVASLKIENGRLCIFLTRGSHYTLPVKILPNLELFLVIVKQDLKL